MTTRLFVVVARVGCIFLLALAIRAETAEVKVLSAFGMQSVLEDLGPQFESEMGHKLAMSFATGGAVVNRVQSGDNADIVVTLRQGIDTLVESGRVSVGSVKELSRVGIFVAVRKGTARPDISSPDALKRALLSAKSISYVDPGTGGASGVHFAKVLDRLGIANEMKPKTIFPNPKSPAAVGVVVADGKAEIGIHILPELISVADIDIVGPLPDDLQQTIVFAAAIIAGRIDTAGAKALIDFLRRPESAKTIKAKGMEPAGS